MKHFKILSALLLVSAFANAQVATTIDRGRLATESLSPNFTNLMLQAHAQDFAKGKLKSFDAIGGKERYFSNVWVRGEVVNNNNVAISGDYKFNFDFLQHEIYAQWKDTAIVLNNSYVKSFALNGDNGKQFFISGPVSDPIHFYEVLNDHSQPADKSIRFLKLRIAKEEAVNKNSYLANSSGDTGPTLSNKTEYFLLFPDQTLQKVKLNKKSLLEALGAKYKAKATALLEYNKSLSEKVVAEFIDDLSKQGV